MQRRVLMKLHPAARDGMMKDKDLRDLNLSEVLAEIQSFLDLEARQSGYAPGGDWLEHAAPGLSGTTQSSQPASLSAAQFYLSRHPSDSSDLLRSLPSDMFIMC